MGRDLWPEYAYFEFVRRSVAATTRFFRSCWSLVDEILVAQFRPRIGQRALGHAEGDAHFGKADADRLGVEHLRAGRLGEIVGIDHVGDERAAERQDDLGAGIVDERAGQLGGKFEELLRTPR